MSAVMNTIGVAFAYAVLALFAQNAIFTRGLGVSRLIQLVGDERTSSWWFALLLCVTQTLVAPLAYFAGSQIVDLPTVPSSARCSTWPVWRWSASLSTPSCGRSRAPQRPAHPHPAHCRREQRRAGHRAGGTHPELYAGAVHRLWPGQRPGLPAGCDAGDRGGNRLRSKAIPEAFRGLPITLIYIGVLALAIYGFTGHSVIL